MRAIANFMIEKRCGHQLQETHNIAIFTERKEIYSKYIFI